MASYPKSGRNNTGVVEDALNQAVAETVVATMMAQNFHWNVTGMAFGSLHQLFQTIYEDHFQAQDELAERVKAIGGFVDGRLAIIIERSTIKDADGTGSDREMVAEMAQAETVIASRMNEVAEKAEQNGDSLTQDLAVARGLVHEKFAWMLNSHLG
ncbi:MAG: DNA starvation/stationary phase protection protein [Rhodobacteraceae bacterium]|nr:DNA starvation/stationary phase protection protein [Paracoccaceae bacterium]